MISKPSTADGYDYEQLGLVRSTCLYIATKLGDLLDEIVVVGGLVPDLLIDKADLPSGLEPHAGTMDLDMGVALAMLNHERYRELSMRLRDAGFKPDLNVHGRMRLQTWTGRPAYHVSVDFLIPPTADSDQGGRLLHIESDLAAVVTPGLELAFQGRRQLELSGRTPSGASATRTIPVCNPGAFTVLKALAFGNRAENKDAYDLFYVWSGVGIPEVVKSLTALQPSGYIDDALEVVARDFCNHDGLGPLATAEFIMRGPDDNVQADVVGRAGASPWHGDGSDSDFHATLNTLLGKEEPDGQPRPRPRHRCRRSAPGRHAVRDVVVGSSSHPLIVATPVRVCPKRRCFRRGQFPTRAA